MNQTRMTVALLLGLAGGCYRSTAGEPSTSGTSDTTVGVEDGATNEGRFVGGGDECRTDWVLLSEGSPEGYRPSAWEARDGRLTGELGWVLDIEADDVTIANGLPLLFDSGEEVALEAGGPARQWVAGMSVLLFGGAGHADFDTGSVRAYEIDAPPEPGDGAAFVTVMAYSGTSDTMTFWETADSVEVAVSDGPTRGARLFEIDARFPALGAPGCPEPGTRLTASFEIAPRE